MRIVTLLLCTGTIGLAGCVTLNGNIKGMGYAPVRPPQKVVGPGTLVAIESKNPLILKVICTADSAYGMPLETKISETQTGVWSQKASGSFDASAEYQGVKGTGSAKGVRSVQMQLSDAKVIVMPLGEIAKAVSAGAIPAWCVSTAKALRSAGKEISIVSEVLEADVTYSVEYEAGIEADAEVTLAQQLAPKLGATYSVGGTKVLTGSELWWGIRDEPELVRIYLQDPIAPAPGPTLPGSAFAPNIAKPEKPIIPNRDVTFEFLTR